MKNEPVFDGLHKKNEGNIVMRIPFKDLNITLSHNRLEVYPILIAINLGKLNACVDAIHKYTNASHVEPVPLNEETPKRLGKTW